ncbi:LPXTG cell wall anchor domain-containing protein [Enterococcus termitis]|jgi:LPXTG-motif cell wall-anchored protein|uniref:Gram-positive cocci surface proteins LPxTG domain-containing protein n=1 Tax=Enterococcus termitis TaxID=332950 RepID=A0A1E5GDA4_9ENTE|nr:LPXTG cell wall anchor domain-containing protein [Enterococcus termitis]OEG10565.1 hypothetical protein BCR25_08835 [Enterococcus termitis]OJG97817.1 LPXTG-domain-containing protein cell wall anchor domain [Enterococcus termitis]
MKKLIWSSICMLFLFVPFFGTIAQASGKTQSDITFTQGEQPKNPIIDKVISGDKQGILPHTGEQLSVYLLIIGICLLSFIYLKNKNTRKKEQE